MPEGLRDQHGNTPDHDVILADFTWHKNGTEVRKYKDADAFVTWEANQRWLKSKLFPRTWKIIE